MATRYQLPTLVGEIVKNQALLETMLSTDDAQAAILDTPLFVGFACKAWKEERGKTLAKDLNSKKTMRRIPPSLSEQFALWREVYTVYFGFLAKDLVEPKFSEGTKSGWLVVVCKGLTFSLVRKAMQIKMKMHQVASVADDPSIIMLTNERTADKDYCVIFRDCIEADEEFCNTSASDIAKKKMTTITLLERLLLELYVFHFTGQHMDVESATLCAGSRDSNCRVPYVDLLLIGEVRIDWVSSNRFGSNLGIRAVQEFIG